jgi:hypothetical protein
MHEEERMNLVWTIYAMRGWDDQDPSCWGEDIDDDDSSYSSYRSGESSGGSEFSGNGSHSRSTVSDFFEIVSCFLTMVVYTVMLSPFFLIPLAAIGVFGVYLWDFVFETFGCDIVFLDILIARPLLLEYSYGLTDYFEHFLDIVLFSGIGLVCIGPFIISLILRGRDYEFAGTIFAYSYGAVLVVPTTAALVVEIISRPLILKVLIVSVSALLPYLISYVLKELKYRKPSRLIVWIYTPVLVVSASIVLFTLGYGVHA